MHILATSRILRMQLGERTQQRVRYSLNANRLLTNYRDFSVKYVPYPMECSWAQLMDLGQKHAGHHLRTITPYSTTSYRTTYCSSYSTTL